MTVGRFAPTPSGRMHIGNAYCALVAWLSARSQGGNFLLRIEDLDETRCSFGNNAEILIDDLRWLGLDFDGGTEKESYQSCRFDIYKKYFDMLSEKGLIYPCYCSRAELHASTAPHGRDGQVLYDGRCRRLFDSGETPQSQKPPAYRVRVPDETVTFTDGVQGEYTEHLLTECTDFVLRRADGIYAYQLAVVVDDALSGVTEVVRGSDLLSSTPRQIWLHRRLGFEPPRFYHIPLLLAPDGRRLSKRDMDTDIGAFQRKDKTPERLVGALAYHAGLIDRPEPMAARELIPIFSWDKIKRADVRVDPALFL